MGKGDNKTRRGKVSNGSYGKVRPHRSPNADDAAESKKKASKPGSSKK